MVKDGAVCSSRQRRRRWLQVVIEHSHRSFTESINAKQCERRCWNGREREGERLSVCMRRRARARAGPTEIERSEASNFRWYIARFVLITYNIILFSFILHCIRACVCVCTIHLFIFMILAVNIEHMKALNSSQRHWTASNGTHEHTAAVIDTARWHRHSDKIWTQRAHIPVRHGHRS